jgi:hypothetical protein
LAAERSRTHTKADGLHVSVCFFIAYGAGDGNRTHATSLEGWGSTIELHPHGMCWCRGPDLNRYGRNSRQILSLLRLPIPPPRRCFGPPRKTSAYSLGASVPFLKNMVGKTGFEPATPWSQAKYSTKLSYFPLDAEMREGGGETKRRGRFASPSNPFTSERWRALRDSNSRPFDS